MFRIESLVVGPFQSNCHVVACTETNDAVIFDAGDDAARILSLVRTMGVNVKAVVNTHAHLDHVAGLAGVVEALGVPVFMHADETPMYEGVGQQALMFGLPRPKTVPIHRWLAEGDVINVGKLRGEVMLMPGHSPGHIIVVFKDETPPRAVVGDVLFQGSIGRTDLPGGDHATLIRSIKEKLFPLGDDIGFICGHGPGGRFGEERRSNPFLV